MAQDEFVIVEGKLVAETEKAFGIEGTNHSALDQCKWIPKSKCEVTSRFIGEDKNSYINLEMTTNTCEWLKLEELVV